jgi:putative chitinase
MPPADQNDAKTMIDKKTIIALAAVAGVAALLIGGGLSKAAKAAIALFEKAFGLDGEQQNSLREIVGAFERYGDGDYRKLLYILCVAWHESRLRPIREIRAKEGSEVWAIQNKYWNTGYFGRGYVQLTWQDNYRKMGNEIGVDLVSNPDAALQPNVAARIMVVGMMKGMFTGKKLADYINANQQDYYNARRTVGAIMVAGTDTAALIVGHLKRLFS